MQKSGSCAFFYGEQTTKEMRERLLNALDTQTPDQIEMLFYKKNRLPFWLLVCVAPVRNECEEVVLFLLAFRDITALKTPFDDEETVKGLSKFARLARSVTRNRSVLQQLSASQTSTQNSGLNLYRNNRLMPCSGGGGGDGGGTGTTSGINDDTDVTNQIEHYGSPTLSNFQNLSASTSSHFNMFILDQYSSRLLEGSDRIRSTSSWLDLIPPYKQEAPKTPPHIILHYVAFKTTWDWLILFLTGYTAVMVPFNAAFKSKTMDDVSFLVVDSIVDVIFFIDIVLNFHTTFVGPNGEVISDATIIRINYLKGWFIVDVLSCLPYDVFNAFQPEATQSTISSLFGALKVVRLLRIGRVTRKLDQYLEYMAASLLLMISGFVLLAHWLACVWYSVGQTDLKNGIYYGWIPRLLNDIDQAFIQEGWEEEGWRQNPPLPRTMTYVTSLYFTLSLITSIGFGNVSATTFGEKLVAAVFMLIGAFGYATIFGNVTTIFQGMYATRSRYHDMMASVKDFIKTHSVPKDLAERVIDYVTSTWAITKGIDTAKVLNYCPKDMKADLCIHLNRMVFNEHPAFRLASDGCLRALAVNFNTIHTAPGDLIFHQGESIDQLCFVVSGSLEVIQDDEIVAFLGRGDVFGEPFWKDPNSMSHSAASVRALTYCDLHCIKKDCLLQVLKFYSAFANSFARNLVLTYDLKTRLIFRKLADVRREYELAEHRKTDNALSSLRADHPVRRMIHKFRRIGTHNQSTTDSPINNGGGGITGVTNLDNELMRISQSIQQTSSNKESTNIHNNTTNCINDTNINSRTGLQSKWGNLMKSSIIHEEHDLQDNQYKLSSSSSHSNNDNNMNMNNVEIQSIIDNQSKLINDHFKKLELSNESIIDYLMKMQNELKYELNNLMNRMNRIDDQIDQLIHKFDYSNQSKNQYDQYYKDYQLSYQKYTTNNHHHDSSSSSCRSNSNSNNNNNSSNIQKCIKTLFTPSIKSYETSTSLKSHRTSNLSTLNKVHPLEYSINSTINKNFQQEYRQQHTPAVTT
ncbi:Potassium voltage-gated channel protein eag [Schistosoma japonicum]|nr:Potassium voltage-gated channel protein eag [Schistosoma japonicum]